MFCPRCGAPTVESNPFCDNCGNPLSAEPVIFSQPKKGSHWPPVSIMAVMLCIGLVCFFLFPKGRNESTSAIPTPDQSDSAYFSLETGSCQFYPEYYTGGPSLTIPDTIDGTPVLRLGKRCFFDIDMLEEIILPGVLIGIDDYAFDDCDSLRGIYIPRSVFRIGSCAFNDCDSLEAIYIHGTIQTIEDDAFSGCEALRHLFFDGTLAQWQALFSGELPISVTLYCTDGAFRQGASIP